MADDNLALKAVLRKLNDPDERQRYVPPERIAEVIRTHPDTPLPTEIRDYVCDFLEGKIKAPAGRPRDSADPVRFLRRHLLPITYREYYTWLKKRNRRIGLAGWEPIMHAHWWQGPPHERAARMTARRYNLPISWMRIKNIVSELS